MAGYRCRVGLWLLIAVTFTATLAAPVDDDAAPHPNANQAILNELDAAPVNDAPPSDQTENVDFLMPDVHPTVDDTYLCYPMKLTDEPVYLTGFVPHANMSRAHHVLLYGCAEPGEEQGTWNCGEMLSNDDEYQQAPVCSSGSHILYAWAMDAPQLQLPPGVGFKVGGKTSVQWLVLQIHYKDTSDFKPPKNEKDRSGITMVTTSTPQPKRAGVYLLGTDGEMPPHSTTYMETACGMSQPVVMHPFGFRTHAHTHGKVVAGYRVRGDDWEEIGRKSPQEPQMFYPVSHPGMVVEPGDILAARCTMVNDEDRTIFIGSTQNDEMCNFYIMYWVDGDKLVEDDTCFSDGPPQWYWSDAQTTLHVENVPNNASVVPGTDDVVKATVKFFKAAERQMDDLNDRVKAEFLQLLDQWENGLQQEEEFDDVDPRQLNDVYGNYQDEMRQGQGYYNQKRYDDDYRW